MDDEARLEAETALARRREGNHDRNPFRLRHRNGHDVWIEADSSPLTDADGAYAGAITLLTDVTEERHVEAALRRERERFRRLVQESTDLILVTTTDGTIDYASPAVEAVLGYRPDDLRGRTVDDLVVDPDDGTALRSGMLAPTSRLGETVPNEIGLRHRDGSTRYCEVVARNLVDDPSVRGIVVNARDVTDARRAERRLRALFEASNDIVTILQPDGNWFSSPAGDPAARPPARLRTRGWAALARPSRRRRRRRGRPRRGLRRPRSASEPLEFRARTADGGYRWLEAVAADLRDDPLVGRRGDHGPRHHRAPAPGGRACASRRPASRPRSSGRRSRSRSSASMDRSSTATRSTAQIVGVPVAELIGSDAVALVHPDDAQRAVETSISRIAEPDRRLSPVEPIRMCRTDGTEVWVRFDSQIVHDPDGEPAYVVATMNDITEQKDAEEALDRSEHWFRTLVQNQSDLVTVVGFDGVLTYVSPNCATRARLQPRRHDRDHRRGQHPPRGPRTPHDRHRRADRAGRRDVATGRVPPAARRRLVAVARGDGAHDARRVRERERARHRARCRRATTGRVRAPRSRGPLPRGVRVLAGRASGSPTSTAR